MVCCLGEDSLLFGVMKRWSNLVWILGLGVMMLGCATTPESRIAEHQKMFKALPEEVQEMVADGEVAVGFNRDMVYLALGTADQVATEQTENGPAEVWTYIRTASRTKSTGSARHGYHLRKGHTVRNARRHHMPRYGREKTTRAALRIVFEDDRVTAIDRP